MKTARDEELEVPLAPLIDIVFLLIIFFVITASMQNEQIDEEVKLAKSYYVPPVTGNPKITVIINVRKNPLNNEAMYNVANVPMSLSEIKNLLVMVKNSQGGANFPVIIRADWDIRWKDIDRINRVLGEVGMYQVVHSSEKTLLEN
jgi:biopolymer transport protein ExbD